MRTKWNGSDNNQSPLNAMFEQKYTYSKFYSTNGIFKELDGSLKQRLVKAWWRVYRRKPVLEGKKFSKQILDIGEGCYITLEHLKWKLDQICIRG